MMKTTLKFAVATLALGMSGAAMADHHGGKRGADANGDGVVTLEEMQAQSARHFEKMDVDDNGVIDAADRKARHAQHFSKIDSNGDGQLSQEEMQAAHETRRERHAEKRARLAEHRAERRAERFAKFDADGSGGLDEAELRAMHEARKEHRAERRTESRVKKHRRMQRHGMRMLKRADTNGDSAVSRAEFDAAVAARFARVDTDGDGQITAEERKAAHAERKKLQRH